MLRLLEDASSSFSYLCSSSILSMLLPLCMPGWDACTASLKDLRVIMGLAMAKAPSLRAVKGLHDTLLIHL